MVVRVWAPWESKRSAVAQRRSILSTSPEKHSGSFARTLNSLDMEHGFKVLEMDLTRALDTLSIAVRHCIHRSAVRERRSLHGVPGTLWQPANSSMPAGFSSLEHSKRAELPESVGSIQKVRSLVQGDAALAFYRAK